MESPQLGFDGRRSCCSREQRYNIFNISSDLKRPRDQKVI